MNAIPKPLSLSCQFGDNVSDNLEIMFQVVVLLKYSAVSSLSVEHWFEDQEKPLPVLPPDWSPLQHRHHSNYKCPAEKFS